MQPGREQERQVSDFTQASGHLLPHPDLKQCNVATPNQNACSALRESAMLYGQMLPIPPKISLSQEWPRSREHQGNGESQDSVGLRVLRPHQGALQCFQ